MLETPQTIDLIFAGRRHWFYVYRYTTDQELIDALHRDDIDDQDAYEKGVLAYTASYPKGDECGRMYLLDKSVGTLAYEATHMALGILARSGNHQLIVTAAKASRLEEDLCGLIGIITSELYSKSKHF